MEMWRQRGLTAAVVITAGLLLSACIETADRLVRAFADEDSVALSEDMIDALLAKEEERVRALIHPDAQEAFTDDVIEQIFAYLPESPEARRALVQSHWSTFTTLGEETTKRFDSIFRLDFEASGETQGRAEFFHIQLFARGDEPLQMIRVDIFPVPQPVYGDMSDWPVGFWIAVVLAPMTALLCVAAIVAVWRTRRLKRRILWTLFSLLIGYPVFAFSSATGDWVLWSPGLHGSNGSFNLNIINFTALSASWTQNMFTGHHLIQVAAPIGALLFFMQKARGKLALKPAKGQSEADGPRPAPPSDPAAS
jgi:hypothetical protein